MKIYDKEYVYSTLVKPDHVGKAPLTVMGRAHSSQDYRIDRNYQSNDLQTRNHTKLLAQQIYEFLETHKVTHIVAHNERSI